MSSPLNAAQNSSINRHLNCLAAGAADPLVYLKRAFAFISKQQSVAASFAWMKFDDDLENIAEAGTKRDVPGLCDRAKDLLQTRARDLLFRPKIELPIDNTERWTRTGVAEFPTAVNLVIASNGNAKSIFCFVLGSRDLTTVPTNDSLWAAYENGLNEGLQACIRRVNKTRKSMWESKRTPVRRAQTQPDSGEPSYGESDELPNKDRTNTVRANVHSEQIDYPPRLSIPLDLDVLESTNDEEFLPEGINAPSEHRIQQTLENLEIQVSEGLAPAPIKIELGALNGSIDKSPEVFEAECVAWSQFQGVLLARAIAPHLVPKDFSVAAVNEIKNSLGTGRVSIAWKRGGRFQILAVSGSSHLDRRADSIRTLEELVQTAADNKTSFFHPDDLEVSYEEILAGIEEYYEQTQNRSIAIQLISAPRDVVQTRTEPETIFHSDKDHRGEPLAALIVEGIERKIEKVEWDRYWNTVESIIQHGVQNATEVGSLFFLSYRRRFGRFLNWLGEKKLKRAKQLGAGLAVVLMILAVCPAPMTVVSHGIAQPQSRVKVYSEVNGTVDQILFRDHETIDQGTPLLIIKNTELELERKKLDGEYAETERSIQSIRDQLNSTAPMEDNQVLSLRKERAGLIERLQSLDLQIALVAEKQNKLRITSPIKGKSITWDLPQRLNRLPVEPGQHLLTVADDSKPWELEVLIPESLIGYVRNAQESNQINRESLEVSFVLASDPGKKYQGKVISLADTATFDEKEGMVLRAKVSIDNQPENWAQFVKPGTSVIARINLGSAPWIYTTTYQLIDSLRRFLFKYL